MGVGDENSFSARLVLDLVRIERDRLAFLPLSGDLPAPWRSIVPGMAIQRHELARLRRNENRPAVATLAMTQTAQNDSRVAVLVDCDNTSPEVLEHALRVVAQYGRVVLRRGYGNHGTLANKWQEALVRLAFTPCLQYQYAPGKNTADLALALDAMEALFDRRADTFCLVTSDSDFSYLCRKLRERGATVHIVGEAKTPAALRNASDQFFEWTKPEAAEAGDAQPERSVAVLDERRESQRPELAKPGAKRRPKFVVEAVGLLASDTSEGKVHLGALGQYLKRTDPSFSPQTYGHSGLLDMVRTYDLLTLQQEVGGHWSVRLNPKPPAGETEANGQAR
jgi:uncharacterized protein (TIGR00288 family)